MGKFSIIRMADHSECLREALNEKTRISGYRARGLYQSLLINLDAELAKLDDRADCAHAVPLSIAFHNVAAFIGRKPMLRGL